MTTNRSTEFVHGAGQISAATKTFPAGSTAMAWINAGSLISVRHKVEPVAPESFSVDPKLDAKTSPPTSSADGASRRIPARGRRRRPKWTASRRLARLPPLDRAADRVVLLGRGPARREQGIERLGQLAARHLLRPLPVVVDAAVVGEPSLAVEHVDVRRAHRPEGARHVLRLVDQVREAVGLLAPAPEELGRPVVGIVGRVVGTDADELHAARRILAVEGDDTILYRLHVRTVVADEHHDQHRRGAEVVARVHLA